jgi:hypothetical protein
MSIVIDGTTGVPVSPVTGILAVANGGSGVTTSTGTGANVLGTSPSISGAVLSTMASSVITSGTAVASTSGTSIDFTGIPSWVKRITVMFSGVSTNGASAVQIQIGNGSVITTGYAGAGAYAGATNSTLGANSSTGLLIESDTGVSVVRYGWAILTTLGSNIWVMGSQTNRSDSTYAQFGGGGITLGGTLDRVRITTVGGANTFDAGSINILYE